jgi:hypothetical protein
MDNLDVNESQYMGIAFNEIFVIKGPMGSSGFRSGQWTVHYKGIDYRVFASVPHCMELQDQDERVKREFIAEFVHEKQ